MENKSSLISDEIFRATLTMLAPVLGGLLKYPTEIRILLFCFLEAHCKFLRNASDDEQELKDREQSVEEIYQKLVALEPFLANPQKN